MTTETVTTNEATAARISIAAAAVFLGLLVVLHFFKPEFDPSWRFVSEYSIGDFGWLMKAAFFSLALSCAFLFSAVRSHVDTMGGRIGLALLLISAAALAAAGIFDSDPVTAKPDELTSEGNLHGLAGAIGIPGLPIAAVLISRSLALHNPTWLSKGRYLRWAAHLTWISVAAMSIYILTALPGAEGFGPGMWNGWLNRLVVLAYCVWLITAAWSVIRIRGV